jgi:cell division septum initiation protein DivIVA
MNDNLEQLQKLTKLINTDRIITPDEIEQVISAVTKVLANNKKTTEELNAETKEVVEQALQVVSENLSTHKQTADEGNSKLASEMEARLKQTMDECRQMVEDTASTVMAMKPQDGLDADPKVAAELAVPLVMEQLPKQKEFILTGEDAVEKINALPLEPEFQIDASHIKNLPKQQTSHANAFVTRGQVFLKDLSSSLDGSTKIFAMPAFDRILLVSDSSFPYAAFKPDTDYTVDYSAYTITFTSQIDETTTLASGQTLLVMYTTL